MTTSRFNPAERGVFFPSGPRLLYVFYPYGQMAGNGPRAGFAKKSFARGRFAKFWRACCAFLRGGGRHGLRIWAKMKAQNAFACDQGQSLRCHVFFLLIFAVLHLGSPAPATAQSNPDLSAQHFPNTVKINDGEWQVSVLEGEHELDQSGPLISLEMPAAATVSETQDVVDIFVAACLAIVSSLAAGDDGDALLGEIEYLNFRVDKDGESLLPYFFGQKLSDGKCSGTFSFQMPTLSEPFSKHNPNDEFLSVLHSWGLRKPEVSLIRSTSGNFLEIEYELLSAFARDPSTLNTMALCIHGLGNVDRSESVFGLAVGEGRFSMAKIELAAPSSGGFLNFRRIIGKVEVPIVDDQCVPPEQ